MPTYELDRADTCKKIIDLKLLFKNELSNSVPIPSGLDSIVLEAS